VEPFWVFYYNGRLLALPANIRQMVAGTNTLAYYDTATITVKSLIAQTHAGVKTERNFKNHAVNACMYESIMLHVTYMHACMHESIMFFQHRPQDMSFNILSLLSIDI
jgi:hypothetical protein